MDTRAGGRWAALAGTVAVGVLTALQVRVNGQLGLRIGDSTLAAAWSFGSGLVVIATLCLAVTSGRRGTVELLRGLRAGRIPPWMIAGGVAGAFTVSSQSIAAGIIGVSLFTVGFVAGQVAFGLAIDRAGFGPGGVVPITVPRLVGGALALAAVAIAITGGSAGSAPVWMLVLPLLAGAGVSWQQAANGRLRHQVGSALTATLVNFAGGTIVLLIVAAANVALRGAPESLPADPLPYLGGVLGVGYILLSAALVRHTGVLLLVLGSVVGQLVAALVLDAAWPAPATPPVGVQIVMAVVALASVGVTVFPWRRPRR